METFFLVRLAEHGSHRILKDIFENFLVRIGHSKAVQMFVFYNMRKIDLRIDEEIDIFASEERDSISEVFFYTRMDILS